MVDDPNKTEGGSFLDDEDFLSADRPIEEAPRQPINIREMLAQNPSLKVFAAVAGVAVVILGLVLFTGGDDDKPSDEEMSSIGRTSDVSQPPGTAELPPAYEDAVRAASEQRAQEADMMGGSAIPTPIARPSERIEAPVQTEEVDPLSEWRREAEQKRLQRQQDEEASAQAALTAQQNQLPVNPPANNTDVFGGNGANNAANAQTQAPPPLPTAPTPEQIATMAQQLNAQMQTVLDTQIPKESVVVSMNIQPGYDIDKYFPKQPAAGQTVDANGQVVNANATTQTKATKPKPIIPAGTIAYAQIITEANSDVAGPVLAEIASGPLLGGRAIGQFNKQERHLTIQFSRVVKDGVEYSTQAYALDPATTLPGLATDIDNHYFQRVFLPAAARFIEGFAQAATQREQQIAVSNGTVVSTSQNDLNTREELMKGVNEGAQQVSQTLQERSNRPITIKVAAGTRIGLLFVSAVEDPDNAAQQPGAATNPAQAVFNASPYGQAYNAYNAYNNASSQPQQTPYIPTPQVQPFR